MTLVAVPLLLTEWLATKNVVATANIAGFIASFVLLVPAAWRSLVVAPEHPLTWRAVFYAAACAVPVGVFIVLLPTVGAFDSYVAHQPAALTIYALTLIAGAVLARDIEMSAGLAAAAVRTEALLRETEDARLLALRQHLDPHFLFNTLGAIAEWCREDPEVAERALLKLSAMLRTLFEGLRAPLWPLSREVEILRALHRLYEVRDDERYVLEEEVDEAALAATVPPLVLLPLFENAIKHGAPGAPLRFSLRVRGPGENDDGRIDVELWNPGAYGGRREGGTGIETVERRLRLAFGDAARLVIDNREVGGLAGTATHVEFPAAGRVAEPRDERPMATRRAVRTSGGGA